MHLQESLQQVWPAFVLVSGLLLVGLTANCDGVFERAGRLLAALPGSPAVLMVAGMVLITLVTAVLNLDTSVVFLTPVLVHAARKRGLADEPALYCAIYMSNAASLYLPGSNLTNLLVLPHDRLTGGAFATAMLVPALAATIATAAGLLVIFRTPHRRSVVPIAEDRVSSFAGVGLTATLAAGALTILMRNPAPAVFAIGVVGVVVQCARGRLHYRGVIQAIGPGVLTGLFLTSLALGVLARSWQAPAELLNHAGRLGSCLVAALSALLINNLPAAVLLSARTPAHPRALLLGLNIAPNLAVSGSLSAYLWLKAARQLGQSPSLVAFSRRGLVLVPLALICAFAAMTLVG